MKTTRSATLAFARVFGAQKRFRSVLILHGTPTSLGTSETARDRRFRRRWFGGSSSDGAVSWSEGNALTNKSIFSDSVSMIY